MKLMSLLAWPKTPSLLGLWELLSYFRWEIINYADKGFWLEFFHFVVTDYHIPPYNRSLSLSSLENLHQQLDSVGNYGWFHLPLVLSGSVQQGFVVFVGLTRLSHTSQHLCLLSQLASCSCGKIDPSSEDPLG